MARLATWGIPVEVATAVAFHRDPESAPEPSQPTLCLVALARALIDPDASGLVEVRARALGLDPDTCREVAQDVG